ncbi:hypothetical protein ACIQTU_06025 [Brevundimonas sp. NPDC090276]|uniref:hypothetical protein n=1 Tax=Brevundimonas sp. NPDC090276 TaxID=3363956 RepID=UPI003839DDA8
MTTVSALRTALRPVAFDGLRGRARTVAVVRRTPFVVWPGSRRFRGEATWAGRPGISPVTAARLLLALSLLLPAPALARQTPPAPPSANLCVQVDVGGDRAGHLDCAAEALQRAARLAQSQARAAFEAPAPDARSSDLSVGVVSQTAVRQRLGANFGLSVHPQRPVRPAPTPRPGGQP